MNNTYVDEFRGTDMLMVAEVLSDTLEEYECGAVEKLAPVAEISRSINSSSDTKYYDNRPALIINAVGADSVTLTVPVLPIQTLGKITGQAVDAETGALMGGEPVTKYFALGYRLKLTDGSYRYIWRYKGSFSIPDESSKTEDSGTDSSNQTLTFTGIVTTHEFTKPGKAQRELVVDERDGKADVTDFFKTVTTIDTLKAKE